MFSFLCTVILICTSKILTFLLEKTLCLATYSNHMLQQFLPKDPAVKSMRPALKCSLFLIAFDATTAASFVVVVSIIFSNKKINSYPTNKISQIFDLLQRTKFKYVQPEPKLFRLNWNTLYVQTWTHFNIFQQDSKNSNISDKKIFILKNNQQFVLFFLLSFRMRYEWYTHAYKTSKHKKQHTLFGWRKSCVYEVIWDLSK